jgi:hypothetical protein
VLNNIKEVTALIRKSFFDCAMYRYRSLCGSIIKVSDFVSLGRYNLFLDGYLLAGEIIYDFRIVYAILRL